MTSGDPAAASRRPIAPEDVARLPAPGMAVPSQVAFSPGGHVLTYLHSVDGSLEQRLFVLDLATSYSPGAVPIEVPVGGPSVAETELPLDEQLRRERAREVALGITAASWATDGDALLVPLPDGVHVLTGLDGDPSTATSRLVVGSGDGALVGARLSPDGARLAFVRDGEIFVVATGAGTDPALQITSSAGDGVTNGLAEFVAQEEMDRGDGLWWAPDCAHVAYAQVDERSVPVLRIVHQGSDEVGPDAEEVHRYPYAGGENARVRLGVVPVTGGPTIWMDTGDPDDYLARVHWTPGGSLVAEVESRDQRQIRVVALDPASGSVTTLLTETSETYVNLHDDFRPLKDGTWTWSSERSGFRHLELRSASGELLRELTSGQWQVDGVEEVDEEERVVYFTATKDGPTERHLYAVSLDGGPVRRLTPEAGTHVVVVGARAGCFVDRYASLGSPPVVHVRSLHDGSRIATLHDRRDPRIDELGLEPPDLVEIAAGDGTALHGLYYPPDPPTAGLPPLAVAVYGGPHVQLARDDWAPTVALRAQALRRRGVAVLVVDNRGSARRGVAFEQAVWRNLGDLEVADQVAGVRWAAARGMCDPDRVAVYGWSYGGYMALRCLEKAPGTFVAGVAGAPVTDWDGYDTHYTERYMGTPADNGAGYAAASVLHHVGSIVGELLLVHGLVDENVHFRHTARLVQRLVAAGKEHRLLVFPEERHLPRRLEDRAFMEERILDWLVARLGVAREP